MSDEDDKRDPSSESDPQPVAREQEPRRQEESQPLGGCDVEHCQRMHE